MLTRNKRASESKSDATKRVKNEIVIDNFDYMRDRLLKDAKKIDLPNSKLQFKLYSKDSLLFTVLSIQSNKTLATESFGDGNSKISFSVPIDPYFILLEYCSRSTLTTISINDLATEFNWTSDLLIILSILNVDTFTTNNQYDSTLAEEWIEQKLNLVNKDQQSIMKALFLPNQ